MTSISAIVQQAISTGHLSRQAEDQLRELLHQTKYGAEELWAFTSLQAAMMSGSITQQSRQSVG